MSKAIGIFSGGLDSILAVELLRRQGVEILALNFETPFFASLRALESAKSLPVPLRVMDITQEHLQILRNPIFGLGKHMNPCMDCHALMFRKAGEVMEEEGYDFLFSGEVLGQRPFSQNLRALQKVAEASGFPDRILRPLSALRLPPSGPERSGLVDRNRLLGFKGRSRKPQMELASRWGISRFPSPAGGCLLTDPGFSARLRDLWEKEETWDVRDLKLLSVGRHLRVTPSRKVVVGRNQSENQKLASMAIAEDFQLEALDYPSPLVIVPHGGSKELLELAASVCLRYSDAPPQATGKVRVRQGDREWTLEAKPCDSHQTDQWII